MKKNLFWVFFLRWGILYAFPCLHPPLSLSFPLPSPLSFSLLSWNMKKIMKKTKKGEHWKGLFEVIEYDEDSGGNKIRERVGKVLKDTYSIEYLWLIDKCFKKKDRLALKRCWIIKELKRFESIWSTERIIRRALGSNKKGLIQLGDIHFQGFLCVCFQYDKDVL